MVYVVDAMGAAIGEAAVSIAPTPPHGVAPARNEWVTDWFGMAAISVEPGTKYRLKVRAPGFRLVDVVDVAAAAARPSFLRVRLELDPTQVK